MLLLMALFMSPPMTRRTRKSSTAPATGIHTAFVMEHTIDQLAKKAGVRVHDHSNRWWKQDVDILVGGAGKVLAYITIPKSTAFAEAKEMIAAGGEKLRRVLTPEQMQRLEQISLQDAGAEALFKPEMIQALGISPQQQLALARIRDQANEQVAALYGYGAMPATTGSELVARRPPTSQVTSTTCAAPSIAPTSITSVTGSLT